MKQRVLLLLTFLLTFGAIAMLPASAQAKAKLSDKKLVLQPEQAYQLELLGTDAKASWSSSNSKVVTVDQDGNLEPKSVGLSKITAVANGKKYTCKVTVVDYSDMSIEQQEVVSFAVKYVGNKYRYGGSSLTKGTDCSGFTMAVYKHFGYKLSHSTYSQIKEAERVSMSDLEPGDLLFYGTGRKNCTHVAIYIGNKKVVHASNEINGITISDYKYRKCVGAGRVLETETYPQQALVEGNVTYSANGQ